VNSSGCTVMQQQDGTFTDATGRRFTGASSCMTTGASIGYDANVYQRAIADLKAFLDGAFARRR